MSNIDTVLPKETKIHPITLHKVTNTGNKKLSLTKPYYKDNDLNYIKYTEIDIAKSINKIINPPITIDMESLLNIYEIKSIDSLENFIKSETKNKITAGRLLNAWIYCNIKILKNHNSILVSLCLSLIDTKLTENSNIKKDIKDFIEYWLQELKPNTFNLNIILDLKKYLIKKYNK